MITIFTYGTFQTGECRNTLLKACGAKFIKNIKTAPKYKLLDYGSFPGMVTGDKAIVGELYEAPDVALVTFDRIEGVPFLFDRAQVELEDGTFATAYVLVHNEGLPEIKTADWKNKKGA